MGQRSMASGSTATSLLISGTSLGSTYVHVEDKGHRARNPQAHKDTLKRWVRTLEVVVHVEGFGLGLDFPLFHLTSPRPPAKGEGWLVSPRTNTGNDAQHTAHCFSQPDRPPRRTVRLCAPFSHGHTHVLLTSIETCIDAGGASAVRCRDAGGVMHSERF